MGRLMSLRAGTRRPLKPQQGSIYGHQKVLLGAIRQKMWVHRAVLLTFVGPPQDGQITRHLDGDPTNNRLDNLAWGTPAENNADMIRHGRTTRGRKLRGRGARQSVA